MEIRFSTGKGKYTQRKWGQFLAEAEERSKNKDRLTEYETKFKKAMQDYARKNEKELMESLEYYRQAKSQDFERNYVSASGKKIKKMLSRCEVMILTANPIEKAVLHHFVVEHEKREIIRIIDGKNAYFVFKWGKYWIAHVHQGNIGSYTNMGSSATIHYALKHFTPNVIISLGVAFGIDYRTQEFGDVIVSKRILPYNNNKRDEDMLKPDRTQDKYIDEWLQIRLVNAHGFMDSITYGDMLTGGSVLSSFEEKDKICLGYTKSDYVIGGEMEGNALFQPFLSDEIPGVVIKGICDWGVAKNDIYPDDTEKDEKLKDSLQAYAMQQAIKACSMLFTNPYLFSQSKNEELRLLKRSYKRCKLSLLICWLVMLVCALTIVVAGSSPSLDLIRISKKELLSITLLVCGLLISVLFFCVSNIVDRYRGSSKRIEDSDKCYVELKRKKAQKEEKSENVNTTYVNLGNGYGEEVISQYQDKP